MWSWFSGNEQTRGRITGRKWICCYLKLMCSEQHNCRKTFLYIYYYNNILSGSFVLFLLIVKFLRVIRYSVFLFTIWVAPVWLILSFINNLFIFSLVYFSSFHSVSGLNNFCINLCLSTMDLSFNSKVSLLCFHYKIWLQDILVQITESESENNELLRKKNLNFFPIIERQKIFSYTENTFR